jgi:NAD(P)H-dependent FMN reductase
MNAAPQLPASTAPLATSLTAIDARTVLGICTSMKPQTATAHGSATRSVLLYAMTSLRQVYPHAAYMDLKDFALPFFDARLPEEYAERDVGAAYNVIDRAGALLFGVPAYWCGVSGVFKNFVDVLAGPSYRFARGRNTVFSHKPIALIVVGTDEQTTLAAASQASGILESTGALIVGSPILIWNFEPDPKAESALSGQILSLVGQLALQLRAKHSSTGSTPT